jgi:hypothetical protein
LKLGSTIPVITCSACGFSNLLGETFCQKCGVQLPPVASVPPPAPQPVKDAGRESSVKPVTNMPHKVDQGAAKGGNPGSLVVVEKGVVLALPEDKSEIILGRTDPVQNIFPEVDFADLDGEGRGVSRRHARILNNPEGIFLEDMNSTNFTFLNNIQLQPGHLYPLKNGDKIRLGLLILEYRGL